MISIIYVLKCSNDKYYVGKTNKFVEERFAEHIKGVGSEWTKLYKPIEILESVDMISDFDEDIKTKEYMKKFGIDNVRGGSYSQVNLPKYKIKALNDEMCTANNTCFTCGKSGHFSKYCDDSNKNDFDIIDQNDVKNDTKNNWSISGLILDFLVRATTNVTTNDSSDKDSKEKCFRCGRFGHYVNKCYAKTHV